MGARSVNRAAKDPSALGSERVERIISVGGRMLWYQEWLGRSKTAHTNETAESSRMSGAVRKSEFGMKCLAAVKAAAKAGLGPWLLFRSGFPLINPAIPLAAWSRMQSWVAKVNAQSRAHEENAGEEAQGESANEEDGDISTGENRWIEKELPKNNLIWSRN